jgi:L-ribulose-5-phosphate 3-epimerase
MDRRTFLSTATAAGAIATGLVPLRSLASPENRELKPMALGLLISPYGAPEAAIKRVRVMGFSSCFLSLDDYISKFTPDAAAQIGELLAKYELIATTVEVVGPEPLEWNFVQGPSTIGLVPPKTRAARIDALKQVSDFAKLLGVGQVQTHCGFIPENPADALYSASIEAIRTIAQHCQGNGQYFLMETGQETPTTSRVENRRSGFSLPVGM